MMDAVRKEKAELDYRAAVEEADKQSAGSDVHMSRKLVMIYQSSGRFVTVQEKVCKFTSSEGRCLVLAPHSRGHQQI